MEFSVDNMTIKLNNLAPDITQWIERANQENIVDRIWSIDHKVWRESPDDISNRLGWLTIAERMQAEIQDIQDFIGGLRQDGITHVLVLGMGGSSLAPDLFSQTFLPSTGEIPIEVHILDTTDADVIAHWRDTLPLEHTAFIVSTKSGGTVETLSLFKYFYNQVVELVGSDRVGQHFIGITDPKSKLVEIGQIYKFRKVFINDPNIGGRYSALSHFGLVPAAMIGVEIDTLLANSVEAMTQCKKTLVQDNPGALLGLVLGFLTKSGMDKASFILSSAIRSFGDWVEQLIAESSGKQDTGILPVVGEEIGAANTYGQDRVFIIIQTREQRVSQKVAATLQKTGQPLITIDIQDPYDLGGQFFIWEYAIAVAGYVLDINPFNQPNVESAKVRARKMISEYHKNGKLPSIDAKQLSWTSIDDFLAPAAPGDYIAIQAYLPYDDHGHELLQKLRIRLRDRYKLATTFGYGPRFLHSTGQLHKGDSGNGYFIQFVNKTEEFLPIPKDPGSSESVIDFDTLKHAQVLGDADALRDADRPVLHIVLDEDWLTDLARLMSI